MIVGIEKCAVINMYSKKYILEQIEELNGYNPLYDDIYNAVCYLAYLNVGEQGWFLCETNDWLNDMQSIRTSVVQDVYYVEDCVFVETCNTRYTFRLIFDEEQNRF